MAKNTVEKGKKKKRQVKEISMEPLLYLGVIFILVTIILGRIFPNMPNMVSTILYLVGVMALIVYMIQIAFEKRTGKAELSDKEIRELKKAKKKK